MALSNQRKQKIKKAIAKQKATPNSDQARLIDQNAILLAEKVKSLKI